jgi:hypothetical protein
MRVPVIIGRGKHKPRCFPWIIGVLIGGLALSFLLAAAAPAQSSSPNVGIPLNPPTDASGPVTTTATSTTAPGQGGAAPSVTASTAPDPAAPAGQAALVPPAAGFSPLNPGWKADQMEVQVWPEYDEKAVLVFMRFSLPAGVQLPATFKFAVPKGAVIAGIGEIDPNGSFKFNYANSYPPVEPGAKWDIATIQVQEFRSLQIDYYYDPGLPAGAGGRSFPLLLQLPVDVGTLNLDVQEPARATDFKVQPSLQGSGEHGDGFTYAVATFSDVKAGSTLGQLVSYSKPDGEPSAKPNQSAPTKTNTNTVLLAAILVIVVCVGGLFAYRLYRKAGRATQTKGRPRTRSGPPAPPLADKGKRPTANTRNVTTNQGKVVNRFCFACGEELPKKACYCPSCGGAQDD